MASGCSSDAARSQGAASILPGADIASTWWGECPREPSDRPIPARAGESKLAANPRFVTFGTVSVSPESELPRRRNPAPRVHVYSGQSNIVLLTVTAEKRGPWLAN